MDADRRLRADPRLRQPGRPVPALRRAAQDAGGARRTDGTLRRQHLPRDRRPAARPAAQLGPAQPIPGWPAPRRSAEERPGPAASFIRLDPPEHDRLRRLATRQFGPPHTPGRVDGMRGELAEIVTGLIDGFAGRNQVDLVDDFAYPFPVTVICRLLGVPREDEPRFHAWADAIVAALDPEPGDDRASGSAARRPARCRAGPVPGRAGRARTAAQPGDDLLSGLATDDGPDGRMTTVELVSTGSAAADRRPRDHRQPHHQRHAHAAAPPRRPRAAAPRARPGVPLVEELLRYEPPVQILPQRTALADIDIAGATIPKGSPIMLVLAAGNRDPAALPRSRPVRPRPRRTTSTSASAAASTTASARRSPGWRRRSR